MTRHKDFYIANSHQRYWTLILMWVCAELILSRVYAASPTLSLRIAEPYIELHTGPGRAYPVFHVVERGNQIEILKKKTTWYKVRTTRGKTGWVKSAALRTTITHKGDNPDIPHLDQNDFSKQRWALAAMAGDFAGANSLTLTGTWFFSKNLGVELSVTQILDEFSDSQMVDITLVSRPFPEWRISPFFMLGSGVINTDPRLTLIEAEDKTDLVGHVGLGAQLYISRNFSFRMQYKRYTIFQSIDDNQEIDEWKAGFSVFF